MHQPQQPHVEKGLRRWNPFVLNTLYSEHIWHNATENEKKPKKPTGTSHFSIRVYFYNFLVTKLTDHLLPWLPGQGKAVTRSFVWLIKNTKKALCDCSSWFLTKTLHQSSPQKSTCPGQLLPTLCLNHLPLLPSCRASMDLTHKLLCRYLIIRWKYRKGQTVPWNGDACRCRSRQPLNVQVWGHFHSSCRNEILRSQAQEIPSKIHPMVGHSEPALLPAAPRNSNLLIWSIESF